MRPRALPAYSEKDETSHPVTGLFTPSLSKGAPKPPSAVGNP